jgi:hypothetical protein
MLIGIYYWHTPYLDTLVLLQCQLVPEPDALVDMRSQIQFEIYLSQGHGDM